jgi:hypothetical protein
MRIPNDLKPGDALHFSDGKRHFFEKYTNDGRRKHAYAYWYVRMNGTVHAFGDEIYHVIRIERIASKPTKPTVLQRRLVAAKDHLRRKMEGKRDRDAEWIRSLIIEGRHKFTEASQRRLRRIAKRLEGKS